MALNDRKHVVFGEGEQPSMAGFNAAFESINDVVPVADTTERAAVAAAVGPTASRPLFVWRADAAERQNLEVTTDGTTWHSITAGRISGKMWRTGTAQALTVGGSKIAMSTARVAGGFTFDNANDQLVIPVDGIYRVTQRGAITGNLGYWVRFYATRGRAAVADVSWSAATLKKEAPDEWANASDELPLAAGDRLSLWVTSDSTAGSVFGSNEYEGTSLTVTYAGPLNGATPI